MAKNGVGGRVFMNGEALAERVERVNRGGEKTHPKTVAEARDILVPQLRVVADQIAALPDRLRTGKVVVEADVWANYLANSYYPSRLINTLKIAPLGSMLIDGLNSLPSTGETPARSKSYLLAVDATDLEAIEGLFDAASNSKAQRGAADELRQFTGIRLAAARSKLDTHASGDLQPFEAVLHPDPVRTSARQRVAATREVLEKFEALVVSVGGTVHSDLNEDVDGLTFVALEMPAERLDEVARFNPLRSITPSPPILLNAVEAVQPSSAVKPQPVVAQGVPDVLVFDGGVDDRAPLFSGAVEAIDLTGKGHHPHNEHHGAAVTAALLYGDLADGRPLRSPAAHVTHFQVVPSPDKDAREYSWILRQIREQTQERRPRIVNLSLGPKVATEDGEPHRWTAVLDKLAHELDVLFVTAAGNNGERDEKLGLHRVQVPGDMVNGLCVGATDARPTEKEWAAAAYSGRGPGRPGARVQPGVLAYGGTAADKFGRVRGDGTVVYDDFGTSYATPLVTHVAADLQAQLGALADAPTLRALIAHGADSIGDRDIFGAGHGRLTRDADDILNCEAGEATIIYQGLIARDEVRGFTIPLPEDLGSGKYDLSWTVAFSSATDSAEAGEYTNAGLEATFRPHSQRFDFRREDPDTGKQQLRTKDIQKDSAEIAILIAEGWKQTIHPSTRSIKAESPEQKRRDQGKWESLWCANDTLYARSLHEPRIDISHVTREGGRITSDSEDIEFTLVVTISSRSGVPVYAEVENRFNVLTPLAVVNTVTIDADIDV